MGKKGALPKEEIETIRTMRSKGYKLDYISYKTGRDIKTIIKYSGIKHEHRLWSAEEIQKALSLRKLGLTHKEIGKQIGRTGVAVSMAIYKAQRSI